MKKGFTMIELIFVIVILGILASVAIPRLASTRTDAEISATIANIRTLLSDASAYYTVKGEFPNNVTWGEFTSVAVKTTDKASAATTAATTEAYFPVASEAQCIGVKVVNKVGNVPAHFLFTTKGTDGGTDPCSQVSNAKSINSLIKAKMSYADGQNDDGTPKTGEVQNAIAIGSTASVYDTTTPAPTPAP